MDRKILISILLLLCFAATASAEVKPKPSVNNVVRVAVVRGGKSLSLKVRGKCRILTLYTGEVLAEKNSIRKSEVVPTLEGIKVDGEEYKVFGVRITAQKDGAIYVNGRLFRGKIDVIRQVDRTLMVINYVKVEDYLKGVVPAEISDRWPMETLKAQAVAARTFTYYQMKKNVKKEFDLADNVFSQLYAGRSVEKRRTSKAVRETKDQVLTFRGEIFPTFYHACCGGHTENSANVWKGSELEVLKGRECPYCVSAPHYLWKRKISLEKIGEKLQELEFDYFNIEAMIVNGENESGRAKEVLIRHALGTVGMPATNFRLYLGADLIKSTMFELKTENGQAEFKGKGWGHGVGLCQWGAYFMGKDKKEYQEILKFYYPGAKIADVKKIAPCEDKNIMSSIPSRTGGE